MDLVLYSTSFFKDISEKISGLNYNNKIVRAIEGQMDKNDYD